jgi:hypothetical protein
MPISGLGNSGTAQYRSMRRWMTGADIRPDRAHNQYRSGEIAGQIGQLRERIRDMRENGEITRAEARRMRREAGHIGSLYWASSSNGLSDFEADMLQTRISAAMSITSRPRMPTGR